MNSFAQKLKSALLLHILFTFASSTVALATKVFPQVEEMTDTKDVIENYSDYLRFILEIAKREDSKAAHLLHNNYQRLVKYDHPAAARFLKLIRFEMIHKLELMGKSPRSVTTQNSEMRRWVKRFACEWARSADEHLFRSVAMRAAERNQTQ